MRPQPLVLTMSSWKMMVQVIHKTKMEQLQDKHLYLLRLLLAKVCLGQLLKPRFKIKLLNLLQAQLGCHLKQQLIQKLQKELKRKIRN
jgi:hypothetical protein